METVYFALFVFWYIGFGCCVSFLINKTCNKKSSAVDIIVIFTWPGILPISVAMFSAIDKAL